jgi:hypothetical protein
VVSEDAASMVSAPWLRSGDRSAVLHEPAPQGGLARCRECVCANSHHPWCAAGARLSVLEEEVDTVPRPPRCRRVTEPPRAAQPCAQVVEELVEPERIRTTVLAHSNRSTTRSGG